MDHDQLIMMAFDDDTKMCAGCSWKPHGIPWPDPNGEGGRGEWKFYARKDVGIESEMMVVENSKRVGLQTVV